MPMMCVYLKITKINVLTQNTLLLLGFGLVVVVVVGCKIWYPCGSFKGDERSGGLAKNYVDKNLMAGISKSQLDNGIAGSIYKDLSKLTDSVCRSFPQLRKAKDDLEWGYRLGYVGLDEKEEPIFLIEPKEQKGMIDNIKGMFGG
jgi:hypothetical protein